MIINFDTSRKYDKNFWTAKAPVQLPADHKLLTSAGINKAYVDIIFDAALQLELLALAQSQHVSVHQQLLAVFQVLLYRHSNQAEICVADVSGDIPLPVYAEIDGEQTIDELISLNSAQQKNNVDILSIDDIAEIFKAVFAFSPATTTASHLTINYDIALVLQIEADGISGKLFYNPALFLEPTITRMAGHYRELLTSALRNTTQKIGTMPMLTVPELHDLALFNDTIEAYPNDIPLNALFEDQVVKTPANIALRLGDQTMTYAELNRKANKLAWHLVNNGVQTGDNVGLLTGRNFEMIIGMLAILKAGGAYVPADPDYPLDRQLYIFTNSAVSLVLADMEHPLLSVMPGTRFINMTADAIDNENDTNLQLPVDAQQLAYTIYTSGSTGKPKGVMIAHHSAVNLVLWVNKRFNVSANDRLLFITSMCFDLSVYDIFGMLAAGGTIVIAAQHQVYDLYQLRDMMQRYRITFWDSVPTTLDYLVRELESANGTFKQQHLRVAFMSGDWIPVSLPDRIHRFFPNAEVISLGGATEGTVWSNYFPVDKVQPGWKSIPYGKPITNNFFYILNEQLQPVPIGVPGELYIGGVGVARGYANDPEKTSRSFVADPFNRMLGGMMYRTGDLGRMLPDMNMEFLGRKDNQVKINGFRVELGEIESVLCQHEKITAAVVLAKQEKDGGKCLVGYIVPNGAFDKESISDFLKAKLPHYMVPSLWVQLESMPLNSNGKIDRNVLLKIETHEAVISNYQKPLSAEEKLMAEIWQQVLGVANVGLNDNFYELGGHSLMAVQIVSRFKKETGRQINASALFKNPTIASLLSSVKEITPSITSRSLIPIKPTGTKAPLYLVHGDGVYAVAFNELAQQVDKDQPVYGIQPPDRQHAESFKTMGDIARHYINEIIAHNPTGPYAIAGYSFGGFVAVEMERLLTQMGKKVKLVAIFDTNAENCFYNKPLAVTFKKKIRRQIPKFFWELKWALSDINTFYEDKRTIFGGYFKRKMLKLGLQKEPAANNLYNRVLVTHDQYYQAFKNHTVSPLNNCLYLFKANRQTYYVDDPKYLGWKPFATRGLKVFDVPGDHTTMLKQPNVNELGRLLQQALDNC